MRCDTCSQPLLFSRYICITCVDEDYTNQIDFCTDNSQCASETLFTKRNFLHSTSHTLLRTNRHIPMAKKKELILKFNLFSEEIKKMFRSREESRKASNTKNFAIQMAIEIRRNVNPPAIEIKCTSCQKKLTLPCWACADCRTYFFN